MARGRITLSHEIFAAQGFTWNHPNYQHDACKTGFRRVQEPDGSMRLVDVMDIKGSQQPVSLSPTRAKPKKAFYEPIPVRNDSARLNHIRRERVKAMLSSGKIYAHKITLA
jgi:hypothetical protein